MWVMDMIKLKGLLFSPVVCKHDLADSAVEALLAVVVISLLLRISVSVGHGLFVSAEDIANENCWDLTGCDTEVISACFRMCFFC